MVPKIRGKFETEIVIWRDIWCGLISIPIKTTIPLHFYPLRASDMKHLWMLFDKGTIDAVDFENGMIYLALVENEKKRLDARHQLSSWQVIAEYLSRQAKMTIIEWIMSVSELPKEEDNG